MRRHFEGMEISPIVMAFLQAKRIYVLVSQPSFFDIEMRERLIFIQCSLSVKAGAATYGCASEYP